MEVHTLADSLPMLPDNELQELADSIKRWGLRHPLVRHNGVLLDGRNRLKACELAGVEPRWEEFDGDSIAEFIYDVNTVKGRVLTYEQKLEFGVRLAEQIEIEAAERRRQGNAAGGRSVIDGKPVIREQSSIFDAPPNTRENKTDAKAAKAAGVGEATLSKVRSVKRADPEAAERIFRGETTPAAEVRRLQKEGKIKSRKPKKKAEMPKPAAKKTLGEVLGVPKTEYAPTPCFLCDPAPDHIDAASILSWLRDVEAAAWALWPKGERTQALKFFHRDAAEEIEEEFKS